MLRMILIVCRACYAPQGLSAVASPMHDSLLCGLQAPAQAQTHTVPLEKVIDDIVNMGFSRHEVRGVVTKLMESGQSIDLNIVLDRLMNGMR